MATTWNVSKIVCRHKQIFIGIIRQELGQNEQEGPSAAEKNFKNNLNISALAGFVRREVPS